MSEILRKFKTEFPTLNTICGDCGDVFARHNGWECPSNPVRTAFSTELTSLREIKDKLDALAESQGKLLAALNDVNGRAVWITGFLEGWQSRIDKQFSALADKLNALDAGLHETAMRNHQQLRSDIAGLEDAPLDRPGVRKRPKPRGKARPCK